VLEYSVNLRSFSFQLGHLYYMVHTSSVNLLYLHP
jgi:hypothetical protein